MKALYFEEFGTADVLRYGDLPDAVPSRSQALVRVRAIGLNFADIYRRRGNYHLAGAPPYVLGYEGAGEIVAFGGDSNNGAENFDLRIGDRVGFADAPFANAELIAVDTEKLIKLPDAISYETAAAVLLQGLTAHYLTLDSYPVKANDVAVVHAAAGGVGLLLTQIIKLKGGRIIGLVSSEAKRIAAMEAGADQVFLYDDDWIKKTKEFAAEKAGADVVYDSVSATLSDSLTAARRNGAVVFYGMAGGDPEKVDPRRLMDESKTLTGGDLWNILTSQAERARRANELFNWIANGKLKVKIARSFPLAGGISAHEFLESRQATGKVLLVP